MSTAQDIVTSLIINSAASAAMIAAFAVLKNQPVNARIYYAKEYRKGQVAGPEAAPGPAIGQYINLNARSYLHIMDWIKSSLKMKEADLISISGLDSAILLRVILLGMKIFLPMLFYGFIVLVPLCVTDDELSHLQHDEDEFAYTSLDKITISNIRKSSDRLWAHLIAAYLYTGWTCWLLYKEYVSIVNMRYTFLSAQETSVDQFTILCRCIPKDPEKPIKQQVDHFFRVNHPDYYLMTTKGFLGLWGEKVDKLKFFMESVDRLTVEIQKERIKVLQDEKYVMPAAFISFENRWAAAVCAQTRQSRDSTKWLTEWAPEPRDVYWPNLPVQHLQLGSRKLAAFVVLFFLTFFFLIPVSFVQSLANLNDLERNVSFLKPFIQLSLVKSVLQGFLPGLSLKIFMKVLPYALNWMTIFEGYVSYSRIERVSAIKYLAFMLVNIFLGNVITGSTFEQLKVFIETPTKIPNILGNAIPMRASFFITYIMIDGWTNCASELFRTVPFILYHLQTATMVRTQRDRDRATPVGRVRYITVLPRLGLYFLLGFVYSTISPLIIPFILIYLAVAYVVYRNQIINVYEQIYESAGSYWPVMFGYIIVGLVVMHATLIGLMTLKKAVASTPFLLPLPIGTILFWYYCRTKYNKGFRSYALEDAKAKDIKEKSVDPNLNTRAFLEDSYMAPALIESRVEEVIDSEDVVDELLHNDVIQYKGPSTENGRSNGDLAIMREKLLSDETQNLQESIHSPEVIPEMASQQESIYSSYENSPRQPNSQETSLGHQEP